VSQGPASGIRNEDLRRALDDAAARRPSQLGELLARFSGLPGPRPNLTFAQSVGDAVGARPPREATTILAPLADDVAAPDTARVFLPMVAAWGYAALVRERKAEEEAWARLAALSADERAPVRLASAQALASLATRAPRGGDLLVGAMARWLGDPEVGLEGIADREIRWGALATALDAIAERGALRTVQDRPALLALVSRWIGELAEAPRAAERLDARRRALASLATAAALFALDVRGAADGASWLEAEYARARHPDLRRTFEASLARLKKRGASQRAEVLARLQSALASSAKPPRDPTLERKGTRRRGR
jgi:hypothetical protein